MVVPCGPQLQTFCWNEALQHSSQDGRTYYNSFSLNGEHYVLGDCVFLYPEDPSQPPFIARLCSCFHDYNSLSDPHCIEVSSREAGGEAGRAMKLSLVDANRGTVEIFALWPSRALPGALVRATREPGVMHARTSGERGRGQRGAGGAGAGRRH